MRSTLMCLVVLSGLVAVLRTTAGGPGSDLPAAQDQQARQVIQSLQDSYGRRDIEAVMALLHPALEDPPREMVKQMLEQDFAKDKPAQKQWQVVDVTGRGPFLVARVTETEQPSDKASLTTTNKLLVLRPQDGRLLVSGYHTEADSSQFDKQTRVYTSQKGKFSLLVPAGWIPVGSAILSAMVADSLTILAPDLQSKVMMGVVQVPMKLADDDTGAAKKGAEADIAMEKQMTLEHRVWDQGPATVAGKGAYRVVTEFTAKDPPGSQRKRMRIYVSDFPMLYFFLCDAIGPDQFDTMRPQFEAIVAGFRLLPIGAGVTRQEALAAEQAKGAVAGRVYTSDEFNCFIAAPDGWEIRTSPNPAHLAEMQYTKGRSIARLIAAKGVAADKLEEVVDKRVDAIKGMLQEFSESARRKVTLRGTVGIESIQTYRVRELGGFHVKEVTLIRDSTYYMILCQCIEPDDYAVLEPDFDRIIQSFGFIQ